MTYEEAIVWMSKYRSARQEETQIKGLLREEVERLESLGMCKRNECTEKLEQKINAHKEELSSQLAEGEKARQKIEETIEQVDDVLEREVLRYRYIKGHTNRQISLSMRISERYVRKLHRRAIIKITKIVPPSSAPMC